MMLSIFTVLGVSAAGVSKEQLRHLTGDNFHWSLANEPYWAVIFCDGSVAECENEFNHLFVDRKNFEKSLHFGAVGCATDQSLCSTYSIAKFPEVKFFENAALQSTYSGALNTAAISTFLHDELRPKYATIKTEDEWEIFSSFLNRKTVIAFYENLHSRRGHEFKKMSRALSTKFDFAHVTAITEETVGFLDNVFLFDPSKKNTEDFIRRYDNPNLNADEFLDWVGVESAVNCKIIEPNDLADQTKPIVIALYNTDLNTNGKMVRYWCNRIVKIANEFPGLNVVMGSAIRFAAIPGLRNGELDGKAWDTSKPHAVIIDEQDQKFIMPSDFTLESFRAFLRDFGEGRIKPFSIQWTARDEL